MRYKTVVDYTIPDEVNFIHIPVEKGGIDMEELRYHNKNTHYCKTEDDFIIESHKRWAKEGKPSFGQMDTTIETLEDEIRLHNHGQALANFSDLI